MVRDHSESQASSPNQFTSGDTLVDFCAGSRAGTGKTTRLIEWVREQHGDDAVRSVIDPHGDPEHWESGESEDVTDETEGTP
jgi:hypothetical protein